MAKIPHLVLKITDSKGRSPEHILQIRAKEIPNKQKENVTIVALRDILQDNVHSQNDSDVISVRKPVARRSHVQTATIKNLTAPTADW